jgi:hypothetical protein
MTPMLEAFLRGRVMDFADGRRAFVRGYIFVKTGDYADLQKQACLLGQKANHPLRRTKIHKDDIGTETYEQQQMLNRTHHGHMRDIQAALSAPSVAQRCVGEFCDFASLFS